MKKVGIADLKARLSGHLREVKKGEVLLVMERSTPVAQVIPAGSPSGLVTRPAARPLAEVKKLVKRLEPVDLPVDALALLLEDRER